MVVLVQPLTAQDAEGGIEGMVKDEVTMLPLERVNIVVLNSTAGAVSDPNGKYTLSGLQPGEYVVRVSMVGYKSIELPVKVNAGRVTRLDMDLHSVSILLDSVGITGSRPKRDLIRTPTIEPAGLEAARSFVSAGEIRKQGSHTVIEALVSEALVFH